MVEKDKTGKDLERRVADIYRRFGASKVEHDVEMAGNQIDVYVEMRTQDGSMHRIAIEVRDHANQIGVGQVNEFAVIATLLQDKRLIDEAVIVSQCGFTRPARNAAETHGIRLLEVNDLLAPAERTDQPSAMAVDLSHGQNHWTPYGAILTEMRDFLSDASLEELKEYPLNCEALQRISTVATERVPFEGWHRDPFVQTRAYLDERVDLSDLKLGAISVRKQDRYALINSRVVRMGDIISGMVVDRIERDRVVLVSGGRSYTLTWER